MNKRKEFNKHIPRVINLCYKTKRLPDFVLDGLSSLNAGYDVRLFDDDECRAFIGDNFGGDHADCFDYIEEGPIKADFWRACLIYAEGGAYFDVDVEHRLGVDEYLESDATFMTSTSLDAGRVNPIVLMSSKGNPALSMCIREYLRMFKEKEPYGYWNWSICGMLHRALESVVGRRINNDLQGLVRSGPGVYQFANEDARSFTRYKGREILKNHHDLYRATGGQTLRGFVGGAASPAFENDAVRIEVADHPHQDTFEISSAGQEMSVRRTDQNIGWGQNLMLKVRYKDKGITRIVGVGPSEGNSKKFELPKWSHTGVSRPGPKMLVVFAGEAFRHGQHGRERDTEESLEPQRKASMSHMSFLDRVKSRWGLDCDVMLSSYRTKYHRELLGWYGDRLVAHSLKDDLVGLENLVRDAIAEADLRQYESMFVSRVDVEYKDHLFDVFDPRWDRIMFPSICWAFQGYMTGKPDWIPRISDVMEFVPKRLLQRAGSSFHLRHEAWHDYNRDGVPSSDMGLMLDTFHDSDSAKDYNPLFRMASRRDSPKWYSPNLKVGPDRGPVKCLSYLGYPDWRQPATEPYEDEDVVIAYKYDCYLRAERFSISLDKASKRVLVRRLDSKGGWDHNVVLMVRHKASGEERELFVGRSGSNEASVPLNYRPGVYEDDNFLVSVRKHDFPDVFHIDRAGEGRLSVTRLDLPEGWGQSLALTVKNKRTGFKRGVRVGPSRQNRMVVEVNLDPSHEEHRPRVALCIRGAVSRLEGASMTRGSIYDAKRGYVNYEAVAKSVDVHIRGPNAHMQIDTFVHSWNRDLAAQLEYLYKPVASLFEDNEMYADEITARCRDPKDFSGVSHALSCKRVIQLKEQHERDGGFAYDIVVLYRPDVLLWKDMPLDLYDVSEGVFVNAHAGGNGDFHFVMSSEDAALFKGLYDSPLQGNPQGMHGWIKRYVEEYMKGRMIMDDIFPGADQEVIRPDKMRAIPVNVHKIGLDRLSRYGVRAEDI